MDSVNEDTSSEGVESQPSPQEYMDIDHEGHTHTVSIFKYSAGLVLML